MTKPKRAKPPKKWKPRRVVLGEMDLRGITRGSSACSCIKHALKDSYPKLPLGGRIRLIAEVLK